MSYQSPKVTMYDISGNPVTTIGADNSTNSTAKMPVLVGRANTAAPTWTDGYMVPLSTDTSGNLRITGSVTANNTSVTATGSAVPANATYIGGEVTTAAPTYTNNTVDALSLTTAGLLRIDGSGVTQPVSGTVTANAGAGNYNNSAISTTGAAPPASAIYLGGSVTTAAPAYTTGQMSALSLTTAGLLRIDGAYPVNATTPTTDIIFIGGAVTTAAPTYTTGQLSALSLLTTGALRTDNSSWIGSTAPTVGSKTSANSIPVVVASDQGAITVNASTTVGVVDNAAFTDGTTRVQPSGYIFDETAGTALTENDAAAARIDSKRAQIGVIEDGTTRGTRATVKAASTAPVAGDTALVVSVSPNSAKAGITGIVKPLYGTSNQTVTITLASLTNTSSRASTEIDNTTTLYEDVYIAVKVTTAAAGVSTTGYVNIYAYAAVDGGTVYPEAITGTDAAITLTAPPNLVLIGQINANTNGATKLFGPISFCRNAGFDKLPAFWGVVIQNQTGATFNATAGNFAVTYQGVNGQLV